MLNLDPAKLLVIAVVAIILLGPDKLPQVARQVGGAWRSFNEFRHRMETEVRNTMPDLPSTTEIARLARSPSALLDHLSNMGPDETPAETGVVDDATGGDDDGGGRGRRPRRALAERERCGGDADQRVGGRRPSGPTADAPTACRPRRRRRRLARGHVDAPGARPEPEVTGRHCAG